MPTLTITSTYRDFPEEVEEITRDTYEELYAAFLSDLGHTAAQDFAEQAATLWAETIAKGETTFELPNGSSGGTVIYAFTA